jgi:LPS sulfotransferase NodH
MSSGPDGDTRPGYEARLVDYPFLSERSTDRWCLDEYAKLFPDPNPGAVEDSPFTRVGRKFVIGFTPRVGSTLLCQYLFRYGVFVAEFFNPHHLDAGTHVRGATGYRDLCERLVTAHALNGVWGVKAFIQAMPMLFLAGEFPEHIRAWRFVYLTRDNIVRQAISEVIAHLRQSWASWIEPARELSSEDYSYDDIARTIRSTKLSQASWERFFDLYEIEPLRLSYETIVADPEAAAAQVAVYCGLKPGGRNRVASFDDPPLAPQWTAFNAVWEERFRLEQLSRGSTG